MVQEHNFVVPSRTGNLVLKYVKDIYLKVSTKQVRKHNFKLQVNLNLSKPDLQLKNLQLGLFTTKSVEKLKKLFMIEFTVRRTNDIVPRAWLTTNNTRCSWPDKEFNDDISTNVKDQYPPLFRGKLAKCSVLRHSGKNSFCKIACII